MKSLLIVLMLQILLQNLFAMLLTKNDYNYKPCKNCEHFIKNRCKLFEKINPITEKKEYEYALFVRTNKNKCGEYGIYYKDKNYSYFTDSLDTFKDEKSLDKLYLITILYIFVNLYVVIIPNTTDDYYN